MRVFCLLQDYTGLPAVRRSRGLSMLCETSLMRNRLLSYKASYTVAMADTITFRPDEDTSKALEVLTKDGTAVSAAVRSALIDAARRKVSAAIRAEAERLAEDESDRAEAIQVLRDMETLRAW
jgi:hypothetical protein